MNDDSVGKSGGLIEIDDSGKMIRSTSSADPAFPDALLTPYSLLIVPDLDRIVSTNSSMHVEEIFHRYRSRCGASLISSRSKPRTFMWVPIVTPRQP